MRRWSWGACRTRVVEHSVSVVAFPLVVPLLTLVVWLHGHDRWAPVADLALTEMHVRSVGTAHTPLIGLVGRLGRLQNGSHPGPLGFYLLAPVYRLLGSSYWALRASTAAFNGVAIVTALLIARRRGGAAAVIATGMALGFLELGYGLSMITEPWNPNLPLLWFAVFLLAVWSVVAGDARLLPIAAVSGSICAQSHIPYVAMCGGLGLAAFGLVVFSWVRAWRRRSDRREQAQSCLRAAAIVAVLWAPPVLEQSRHDPGNLAILVDYFGHPPAASAGLGAALPLVLVHLDAFHLLVHSLAEPGLFGVTMDARAAQPGRGAVFLLLWLAAAGFSVKLGNRSLLSLHGVVAASVLLAWVAFSRIMGPAWIYLTFCGWEIGALLLFATVSTATLGVWTRMPEQARKRANALAILGVVGIAACTVRLSATVARAGSTTPASSTQLAALAPQAVAAIRERLGAATGAEGRYLVTWSEPLGLAGGEGIGLVNELERQGFHVGVSSKYRSMVTEHRVLDIKDATARIHVAQGGFIRDATRTKGAVRIAYSEQRTLEEREEFARLRAGLDKALRDLGRADVARAIDRDLPGAGTVPGLHPLFQFAIARMCEIGMPAAVFVMPP
jgi:hypothetical protein